MLAVSELSVETYLACKQSAVIREKAITNNIKVFVLPFRGNADFKTLFALISIIKKHQIDIVNTHSGKDTWVGGLAAKLAGAKFIRTRHLSIPINTSRLNFINELADYIFTTGESIKENMIKFNRINPDKIKSIATGIDPELFNPHKYNRTQCRQKFNIQDDEIVIGIVAILRQFKRHDLFLEMASQLIKNRADKKIKFLIAGDGPRKQAIEELIMKLGLQNNVVMLGYTNEVPELLVTLDIFVLSSDSKEGVPQSVIQALMMNKKVVATNSGSTKNLFHDNNFQLVDVNQSEALVKGVNYYLEEKNSREINTRMFVIKHFSLANMALKVLDVYKEIL